MNRDASAHIDQIEAARKILVSTLDSSSDENLKRFAKTVDVVAQHAMNYIIDREAK